MSDPSSLLPQLMRLAPFQPATNLWRAFELAALEDKALPLLSESHAILDLGCGDGTIMRVIRDKLPPEAAIVGIDLDPKEVELAKGSGVYKAVYRGGANKIPLRAASQDAVISNSVLEHIKPIYSTLADISRILKTGGWFVATVPGPDFHKCLRGAWLPGVKHENYCKRMDARLAHERYWSAEEWQDHLSVAGITLVHALPYLIEGEVRRWELISRLTGGLLSFILNKKPIVIQRKLGMRQRITLPKPLATFLSRVIMMDMDEIELRGDEPYGCLLIIGQKKQEDVSSASEERGE